METRIKIYDQFDELLADVELRRVSQLPLNHLASELMEHFGYQNDQDMRTALIRTFEICCALKIPINQHFKKIYRCQESALITDWQISDFASYLLLLNGNSRNPNVAEAQLQYFSKLIKH
ncbi:MAG: hypothetical protein ACOH2A_07735 [Sphingobacteriaceae bacterium]